MDPLNTPCDLGPYDGDATFCNASVNGSFFSPADNASGPPAQTANPTWTTPFEAVSGIEHTALTSDTVDAQELTDSLQDPDSIDQARTENHLSLSIDDHLQTLYDAYHASYTEPISKTLAHMEHAKALALAMLQRHYPESQDYLIEPASLGPLSTKGINFILKEGNEPDSDPDTPPSKKQKRTAKTTNIHYSYEAPWHWIEPENMAVFVVKKRLSNVDEDIETFRYRTHTYLVVIIDDLSTFHRWSRVNLNHRGDVLSDLLGVKGNIEKGHGMLFFGPRLELYNYDADSEENPVMPYQNPSWKLDMRTTSLTTVDEVLSGFAKQEVVHQAEI